MRKSFLVMSALVVVACARKDDQPAADSPAAATMPARLTFADLAGRWSVQLLGDMSDTVLAMFELNATADGTNWTMTHEGHAAVPVRAAVEGDSLQIDAGPYKSTAPGNVNVTTHGVSRLEGGMLVGNFESQYALAKGDSIVRGRLRGTRLP